MVVQLASPAGRSKRSTMRPVHTRLTIAVAMFLVLIIALATTAVLGYFVYDRMLSGLVTSRFEFTAKELKNKIEAGIDLGLPLGQLENIDELLLQEKSGDSSLVAISIINSKGTILFDTAVERVGKAAPSVWAQSLRHAELQPDKVYFGESEIGLPLFTSFGKMVGILLVRYSKTFYDNKKFGVIWESGIVVSVVLLGAGVIGVIGIMLITRPLETAVTRLAAGLSALRHRIGLALPDEPEPGKNLRHDSEIERELLEAITSIEQAEQSFFAGDAKAAPTGARL